MCSYGGKENETPNNLRHIKFQCSESFSLYRPSASHTLAAHNHQQQIFIRSECTTRLQNGCGYNKLCDGAASPFSETSPLKMASSNSVEISPDEAVKNANTVLMDPSNWGWELRESQHLLCPVYTDKPPAPTHLLKLIGCKCQTDRFLSELLVQKVRTRLLSGMW